MVDPVVGGLAGELLQDGREVLGGDAHLAGIEANGVFFAAVLEHQFQKLLEQLFLTRQFERYNVVLLNDDVFSDILYLIATNSETYRKNDDENESTLRKCTHVLKQINSKKSNQYIEKLKSLYNPNVYSALENYN